MKQLALITGASSTIGIAIAKVLAENGTPLILHYYRNKKRIDDLRREFPENDFWAFTEDLSTIEGIENLFFQIKKIGIHPTILINNVGIPHYGLIQDVTFTEYQKIMNLMVMSTFFCSQKAISNMLSQKFGRIINISSIWGQVGAANEVLYSMAKGAIDTFTKALAKELAPSGITVNAIAPGIVLSPMMEDFSKEELEIMKNEIPMNRFAQPEEIAYLVLHLLRPESSYITGQIIRMDGGWY
ncbi:elongation factor P 5-aminopentanone reductase [Tepidibacillus fermentans]|uniref:3-oxoacyl-[acyl-carrier protein] reductase n=1 Tax=Tepidibacillus fermentans TaxID=1281767 RepID=A0A4R3KHR5_9BACI|nr:SDR family oxidoreductase [Tepidibacillus fermentans]TCS83015.1 3-oxoacyl-[acyl-carrier protein] reductase [Tepidibacillus fermentans]